MSLSGFLRNVRIASGFLAPQSVEIQYDAWNADYISDSMQRSDLWLTPHAVNDFDPDDFTDLSNDTKQQLIDSVEKFKVIAQKTSDTGTATEAQVRDALPIFHSILQILSPYLSDPEGVKIEQALWAVRCKHREEVLGYDFELRLDSTGDPAVVVWIVFPDETPFSEPTFQEWMRQLEEDVEQQFVEDGIVRYPYIRVRAESEVWEPIEVDA